MAATYAFVGYQDVGDGVLLMRHTRTFAHGVASLHHVEGGAVDARSGRGRSLGGSVRTGRATGDQT
ncbi:MAG: hypothetical protein PVI59_02480 [Anaerolineae bacterium]